MNNNTKVEIWEDIDGFDNYRVSNLGNVLSKPREVTDLQNTRKRIVGGKLLKPYNQSGYHAVTLRKDNKSYRKYVHRLVAKHFCNQSEGKNVVNHLDGNKTNNKSDNLEWTTHQLNLLHAKENGLNDLTPPVHRGEDAWNSVFKTEDIKYIRKEYESTSKTYQDIGDEFGVDKSHIYEIVTRRSWKHVK